jgi:hypothetical protein
MNSRLVFGIKTECKVKIAEDKKNMNINGIDEIQDSSMLYPMFK